jgi:hypothetical protein
VGLGAVLLDDPQRPPGTAHRVRGDGVDVVERPVERVELGPPEVAVRGVVVVAVREKESARGVEGLYGVA